MEFYLFRNQIHDTGGIFLFTITELRDIQIFYAHSSIQDYN